MTDTIAPTESNHSLSHGAEMAADVFDIPVARHYNDMATGLHRASRKWSRRISHKATAPQASPLWILKILFLLLVAGLFEVPVESEPPAAQNQFALAPVFSDHAVLQRDKPLPIWGMGNPTAKVKIILGSSAAETVVGADGMWQVLLNAQPAAENLTLLAYHDGQRVAEKVDLALGDVWLCSGQSNMEFELYKAANGESEVAASNDSGLRLLLVPRRRTFAEVSFGNEIFWTRTTPDTTKSFSAACYYMGRELRRRQKIPIGLIAASWGGSRIEDWLSRDQLGKLGGFAEELAAQDLHTRNPSASTTAAQEKMHDWVYKYLAQDRKPQWVDAPLNAGLWEEWNEVAFAEFDGLAKYRIRFDLPPDIAKRARNLFLGRIDDADWTSVNGSEIGHSQQWDAVRNYPLKRGQLRAGTNAIDIVVLDTGGGGGLWGGEAPAIELDDGSRFPLAMGWEAAAITSLHTTGPLPTASWLHGEGPATLHNGMIAPLGRYAVKGYAWYQGESNAAFASRYRPLLQALIADWRSRFGGRDFLLVQLAGFGAHSQKPGRSNWAELRESQRKVAVSDPFVRLVPAIDIGDRFDIHPTNKKELGRRLALAATSESWFTGTKIELSKTAAGLKIALGKDYQQVGGAASPVGFELCNQEGICRYATATLTSAATVMVEATEADRQLRYLWSNSPLVGLFDEDGIPLPPFRIELDR